MFIISLIIFLILLSFKLQKYSFILVNADENKVHICSCLDAEHCSVKTDNYLNKTCREECAHWINIYKEENKQNDLELTNCFWKEDKGNNNEFETLKKAIKLTKCMRERIPYYCSNTERHFINSQNDYNQLLEPLTGNTSTKHREDTFIRRARSAFLVFRNFQKCMNNCAKRYSIECFKKAECAISLDHLNALNIYNECTGQNPYSDASDSCRCLIKNHRARQLIGICSLLSNAHLMHSMP